MDKCPNCGRSGGFLNLYECFVCKKEFCDNCSSKIPIYGILKGKGLKNAHIEKYKTGELWKELEAWEEVRYAHSLECAAQFVSNFRRVLQESPELLGEHKNMTFQEEWVSRLPKESAEHFRGVDVTYKLWFAIAFHRIMMDLPIEVEAEYFERVGRFEEAAKGYEALARFPPSQDFEQRLQQSGQLQLWLSLCLAAHLPHGVEQQQARNLDRARQAREKSRTIKVKETVVDINKLLEQVRNGGIVVAYRCPRCGGKVKIGKDASVESLKVCEHCGSEIEAMELADFIRTALS